MKHGENYMGPQAFLDPELEFLHAPQNCPAPHPWNLAPKQLAALIKDLSEQQQVDPNFVGACVVGALAIACQSNLFVEQPSGTTTGVNLFIINRMKSGGGKSTILEKIISPIKNFCDKEEERIAKEYEIYNLKSEIFAKKRRVFEKEAIEDEMDPEEFSRLSAELIATKPSPPNGFLLIGQDFTPEALLDHLTKNHPATSLVSAEGGPILSSRLFGQPGIANALFSNESVSQSRASRGRIVVKNGRLSMLICIQPSEMDRIISELGSSARESGLLARLQITDSLSSAGRRDIRRTPSKSKILNEYQERMKTILLELCTKQANEVTMNFTNEGADLLYEHAIWIEKSMSPSYGTSQQGEYADINDAACRNVEMAARIAACAQYYMSGPGPISAENTRYGIEVAKTTLQTFKKLFGSSPKIPEEEILANELFDALKMKCWEDRGSDTVMLNWVLQYGPSRTRIKKNRDRAVAYLIKSGRVRLELVNNRTRIIRLNPQFFPVNPNWHYLWTYPPQNSHPTGLPGHLTTEISSLNQTTAWEECLLKPIFT